MSSASPSTTVGSARGSAGYGSRLPPTRLGTKVSNWLFWGACFLALALVVAPLVWVVAGVIGRAVPNWQWNVLTTNTNGISGGLQQAVLGTIVITIGAIVVAGVISILTGVYLAEFAKGRHRSLLRGGYEVLAGIPSIVLGFCGYVALVVGLGWHFGLLPAVLIMAILAIPYITKATETALGQVPTSYREGAEALGLPGGWALRKIVLKTAVPGMVTGLLVATAIAVGETAPLLYTANWSDQTPSLTQLTNYPVGYLTYPVYYFAPINQPYKHANALSYDAALMLFVFVLIFIILGRVVATISRRYAE